MNHLNSVTCENVVRLVGKRKSDPLVMMLGQQLIREGLITPVQLKEALMGQAIYGLRLGSTLVEMDYLKENDLGRLLSRKTGVPFVCGKELSVIPQEMIQVFSRSLAIRYHVLPFQLEHNCLWLAMADPNDLKAIQEIASSTGHVVQPYVATDMNISQALERYYSFEYIGQFNTLNRDEPEKPSPPRAKKTEFNKQMVELQHNAPSQLAGDLLAASSRDAVANLIIEFIASEFRTGALFVVRKKLAVGWRGARDGKRVDSLADVSLDLTEPSVLRDTVETKACFHGMLINTPQNRQILELLGETSCASLYVAPITIRNQTVALVLVANDMDDSGPRLNELRKIVKMAGLVFEMFIIKNKILAVWKQCPDNAQKGKP